FPAPSSPTRATTAPPNSREPSRRPSAAVASRSGRSTDKDEGEWLDIASGLRCRKGNGQATFHKEIHSHPPTSGEALGAMARLGETTADDRPGVARPSAPHSYGESFLPGTFAGALGARSAGVSFTQSMPM